MEKKDDDYYKLDNEYNVNENENENDELVDIDIDIGVIQQGNEGVEKKKNRHIELMTLRHRPQSPCKLSRSTLHKNLSADFSTESINTMQKRYDNWNTINNVDGNLNNGRINEIEKVNKPYIKSLVILINHVLIQLSFLSILEPLLFFNYIIGLEEEMFYEQLDNITEESDQLISQETAQQIRNQPFYDALLTFIVYEDQNIDGTYNKLRDSANDASDEAMQVLSSLKYQAFVMAVILNSVTIFYTMITKYIYNKKIIKMVIHHITLIIFIGLFEIWFFTTIGSKYFPWSSDEIFFHLFQCFWVHTTDKFPELKGLEHNVTITCEV